MELTRDNNNLILNEKQYELLLALINFNYCSLAFTFIILNIYLVSRKIRYK